MKMRGDGLAQWLDRAVDWRSKGRGFESRQEHKNNFEFLRIKKVCADSLSVCPTPVCIYTRAYERPCTRVKDPVVHVRVRWIMETPKKHRHALVPPKTGMWLPTLAEELKTATYTTPPVEERRKKERKTERKKGTLFSGARSYP